MDSLKNKTVLVIGLGKSGFAAASLLIKRQIRTLVTDISDHAELQQKAALLTSAGAFVVIGRHPLELLAETDIVVASPGVPDTSPLILKAQQRNLPIISEIELASLFYPGPYLAITGSNGKTTTTTWVGETLAKAQITSVVAGNIGRPLTDAVADVQPRTWVVAELSSFQLQYADQFCPYVSAILNLSEDHLDRHGDFANYQAAKAKIFANQSSGDYLVVNADDERCVKLAAAAKAKVLYFSRHEVLTEGAWLENNQIVAAVKGEKIVLCDRRQVAIPGDHNLENALAVSCLATIAGAAPSAISWALRNFSGVEHRCEKIATVDGILYVNDSKGTNPDAAIRAIKAFSPPLILIAGGRDKGVSLSELALVIKDRCRAVILIGEAASKFNISLDAIGYRAIYCATDLAMAVQMAHDLAINGDTVLLSPACASFDMFDSYEHRGRVFKETVWRLGGINE